MPSGFVNVEPVVMQQSSYKKLEQNLMMFYLGGTHSASAILKEQSENIKKDNKLKLQIKMCDITKQLKEELQKNNVDAIGELLNENWMLKKVMASGISNPQIDEVYEKAMNAGAKGGKLLGAGGAGFMLFYVPLKSQQKVRMSLDNLREINFEMDNAGASIIHVDKDFI